MKILLLVTALLMSLNVQADTNATTPPSSVTLNPTTLRQLLLEGNIPLMVALKQVHVTKDTVNSARGALLPSLNLGVALSSLTSGPTFALASIEFLLPFLVPDNWFALKSSEHMLEADKDAYYALQLDTYASAYTTYQEVVGDIALRDVLNQEYQNYMSIYQTLSARSQLGGTVNGSDLENALAQAKLAESSLSAVRQTILTETAAIRELLALPLETVIDFESGDVPALAEETAPVAQLVTETLKIAPEYAQEDQLISAAKDQKWSAIFSFIGSNSLSSKAQAPKSASLSDLAESTTVSIGFSYYPEIQLSQHQVDALILQKTNIQVQQTETIEAAVNALVEVKNQNDAATQAEKLEQDVYLTDLALYDMGTVDLVKVIQDQTQMTQASISKVQSQIAMNALRITLARSLLQGQFSQVKGCNYNPALTKKSKGFFGNVKDVLHPSSGQRTIDDTCRAPIA